MTYNEWIRELMRGVTITPEMAFAAGAASRDAEIAELVAALEWIASRKAPGEIQVKAIEAVAKVRKP